MQARRFLVTGGSQGIGAAIVELRVGARAGASATTRRRSASESWGSGWKVKADAVL